MWDVESIGLTDWDVGIDYIVGNMVIYDNKLYRCIIDHTSTDFLADSANWENIDSIFDWQPSTTYHVGDIIIHDGGLYKVTTSFTSGLIFDDTNLELLSGSGIGGILVWAPNTTYVENQLILYKKLVYRVTVGFTSGTIFDPTNLEQLTIGWVDGWQPNKLYVEKECVIYSGSLYRCINEHTSRAIFDVIESSDWEQLMGGGSATIPIWQPNTNYSKDSLVIYNDTLYLCNANHISSANFEDDMIAGVEKWRPLNAPTTSGGWLQVTKLNVTAPEIVTLVIANNLTFCTAPIEVLKYTEGAINVEELLFTFLSADATKFDVDGNVALSNDGVIFEGSVRLKIDYTIRMVPDSVVSGYHIYVSDDVDLSGFKSIESLEVGV